MPLQRHEVLAARDEIDGLVKDLLAPGEVRARGVALVENLVTDGASPLYTAGPDGELERAVRGAHAALVTR